MWTVVITKHMSYQYYDNKKTDKSDMNDQEKIYDKFPPNNIAMDEDQSSPVTLTDMEDKMAVMVKEYDSEALCIFNLPQGHDYLPTPIPKKVVIKRSDKAIEPPSVIKYNCKKCPYVTTCKRILNKHTKSHPLPNTANNVKCPHCSFTTKKPQYLKVHSKLHYKDKPYKCIYCQVWNRSLMELADHYRSDHGIGKSKMAASKSYAPTPPG